MRYRNHRNSQHNQVITTQKTAGDGIAKFSKTAFPDGFHASMVFAKAGEDFNYMDLRNAQYTTSRFDVGGKRIGENPYDLFLYAERSLYRPGETIHIAGILRDYDWKLTGKMPVTIVLKSPDGKNTPPLDNKWMSKACLLAILIYWPAA
ncbi:MAG: MG2 domain-containing protein [Chitinophagales bacterium]